MNSSERRESMDKAVALMWYREIQSGHGVDRYTPLDVVRRGDIAVHLWDDPTFTFGIEYGVLIALVEAFGLTREDIEA